MPSTPPQPAQTEHDPHEQPVPPRERLEEVLGRDFADFLVDALTEGRPDQSRRGSSSP